MRTSPDFIGEVNLIPKFNCAMVGNLFSRRHFSKITTAGSAAAAN
jgi:hypothetical protein